MTRMRPVVGYNLHPRIPLEVDLFKQVNPSGRIPFEVVDPYRVEPAIVEPLNEDLYDAIYAVPDRAGDNRFFEAISRRQLGKGGLWDTHISEPVPAQASGASDTLTPDARQSKSPVKDHGGRAAEAARPTRS